MIALKSHVSRLTTLSVRPSWLYKAQQAAAFSSTLIACVIVTVTTTIFLASSNILVHWFVLPVSICGVLIGIDAIDWIRGRLDLYDLTGILGLLGFHFFYLAPLLHVSWNFWLRVPPPSDWREWLGYMGILNVVGLMLYRRCRDVFSEKRLPRFYWRLNKSRLYLLLPVCIAISVAMQIWTYVRFGGISGYMQSRMTNLDAFKGWGWIFMISESAPILVTFVIILYFQQRTVKWPRIAFTLLLLFALQMLFGGLRGSRSATVLLLFWSVGCIHLLVRPVPKKLVCCGCVFLGAFMYIYGFYKTKGESAVQAFTGADEREHIAQETGRTPEFLILEDFARADIQAFILYRLTKNGNDFDYATGRTYLGALTLLVPSWVMSEKPATKVKEGTEIQNGPGTYFPITSESSRVYGLAGESMLNFGPISVPVAYALFGFLVGWFRKSAGTLLQGDARLLLIPFGVYVCISAFIGDSDNVVFGIVKNAFMPLLVIMCSVKRIPLLALRHNKS